MPEEELPKMIEPPETIGQVGDSDTYVLEAEVGNTTVTLDFIVWNPAGEMVRCNPQVHGLLPQLADKPLLVDFIDEIADGIEAPFERDGLIRELLFEGTRRLYRCQRGEQELVVNFSTVGTRLANRIVCAYLIDVTALRTDLLNPDRLILGVCVGVESVTQLAHTLFCAMSWYGVGLLMI